MSLPFRAARAERLQELNDTEREQEDLPPENDPDGEPRDGHYTDEQDEWDPGDLKEQQDFAHDDDFSYADDCYDF